MLITTLCRAPVVRLSLIKQIPRGTIYRTFSNENRESISRAARRQTLRERAMAPPTGTAFGIGKGAVAGGAVLGVGALCYYGLGLSNEAGLIENSMLWPQYVKDRIRTTYLYFGTSLAATAMSAMAVFRSPVIMNLVTKNGFMAIAATIAVMMGTGYVAQSIEYQPGIGVKQAAWLLHTSVLGAILAPLCFLGGPLIVRAAWYTAGIVGGLSTVAVCAPSEKFLNMGAPLAMGFGVVFAASLANMFLPPTTALGAGLYSISIYGGLLLFSGFLLFDTQRIIKQAEVYPMHGAVRPYDPINAAMSIYMDTLNIFIRIVTILAGGQRKK